MTHILPCTSSLILRSMELGEVKNVTGLQQSFNNPSVIQLCSQSTATYLFHSLNIHVKMPNF